VRSLHRGGVGEISFCWPSNIWSPEASFTRMMPVTPPKPFQTIVVAALTAGLRGENVACAVELP
jgi:hypothetical protein